MATERDLLYRAKFVDDVTGGVSFMSKAWQSELEKMTGSLQDNILKLRAQKEILTDPVYRQSAKQAAELRQEIKKLTDEIQPGKVQTLSESWASLASKYYLVSQAAGYASRAIGSVVEAASKYELLHARLNAVEGSAALGNRDFADVQTLAKKPGLGFEEAASTFATLRGMKVTAAEAKTLINGIAQANASAAGTAEQFGRVMYQIQQSVSLGRLMQEDLRPIQQAIPTLGAAMQQHFGATQAEQLNKILEKSGKSVREFWLEVAELGSKLPSTGETIANNIDNMGDAWVRFRAALANSDAIKGATRAMTGLLEKVAEFLEKDQAVERSYIVRTKVITQTQQAEQAKYGGAPPAYPAGLLRGDSSLTAGIMAQSLVYKASADSLAALNAKPTASTIWQEVANKTKAQIDAEAAAREAKDKADQEASKERQKNAAAADAARKAGESEAKRMAAHMKASEPNVVTNFDGSVTLRSGIEWETQDDHEHTRNVQRAEDARERAEKAALEERKRAQKEYSKLIQDENQKRIEFERQYWRQVQTSATSTINSIAQTLIMSGGSMKDKLRQILAQGESALISGGINMLMGAAFAPATGGASMAMPGALGLLGSFMGMRATGGAALGPVGVGERGPEVFRPATPGTVYNSSSSHYNYSGPITVVVSGANANEVAKDLPRAIENAQRNRRQTSISR